jgi:hypothetical protein
VQKVHSASDHSSSKSSGGPAPKYDGSCSSRFPCGSRSVARRGASTLAGSPVRFPTKGVPEEGGVVKDEH